MLTRWIARDIILLKLSKNDNLVANVNGKLRDALLMEAAVCFAAALGMSRAKAEWVAFPYAQISAT